MKTRTGKTTFPSPYSDLVDEDSLDNRKTNWRSMEKDIEMLKITQKLAVKIREEKVKKQRLAGESPL
jgi:hypothetical protein